MLDIHDLLDREARRVEPSSDWMSPTLAKVNRHRRARRLATAGLALAIAAGGFMVAVWAFDTSRSTAPASGHQPNYRFHEVTVRSGEGPGQLLVFYGMSYDEYPGVHRCTWRAYGADGAIVGQRSLIWGYQGQLPEADENAVEMEASGPAVRGEAFCDPTRLDTPGISDVAPYPPSLEVDMEQRIEEWATRFHVEAMSQEELEANIRALGMEIRERIEEADTHRSEVWIEVHELRTRMDRLQGLLKGEASSG